MGGGKRRYLSRRGGVHGRPLRWGPALYLRMAADVPLILQPVACRMIAAGRQEL